MDSSARWVAVIGLAAAVAVATLGCGGGTAASSGAAGPRAPAKAETPTGGRAPGGDAETIDGTKLGLGMVLLAEHRLPPAQAMVDALAAVAPDEPPLVIDPAHTDPLSLTFDHGGAVVSVALMPPVPGGEAEYHAQFSLKTIADGWKPPRHQAHLMVITLGGTGTPLERVRRIHRIIAAAAKAAGTNAVGVYVGNGGVTHEPGFYIDMISKMPDAIVAWSGVSVARDGTRASLLSTGMRQLGLPDIVITTEKMPPGQAIATLYDLMLYVAKRGTRLPAGDTVGRDANEHVPVRYAPHPVDAGVEVMQVDYP